MINPGKIEIHHDTGAVARAGAEEFRRTALEAESSGGRFSVALTGGGSPKELYHLLSTEEFSSSIPWHTVHLFWGDDRCVPPDHPRSNFGMANQLFLRSVPIPAENVHRIRGEFGAKAGAKHYEEELRSFFGEEAPRLDLVHLGVGDDGHIASLFPFQLENLKERERLCLPAIEKELGEPRVTLSLGVINAARRVRMLLPDGEQASLVRKVVEGPIDPFRLPAQLVRPTDGEQLWLLTEKSARELNRAS
ncbi:6-phosphogluconolactonase [soil metagenome]